MLADWLSDDGREARAKMGDPVRDLDNIIYRVSRTEGERALAQERDRAREWLVEQHGRVECELFAGGVSRVRVGPAQNRDEHLGDNFDHALIQAVLATKEGGR